MCAENKPPSIGRVLVLGAALIFIAFEAVPAYVMNAHPVSIDSLSSVTTTSTETDVKTLLGEPTEINAAGANVVWVYSGLTWCIITVEFGPDGKVVSVEHDH